MINHHQYHGHESQEMELNGRGWNHPQMAMQLYDWVGHTIQDCFSDMDKWSSRGESSQRREEKKT